MSPHYTPEGEESQSQFYVYELVRPDGRAFYIGKGKKRRMFEHDYEARRGCDCHKCRVIRKIWRDGGRVERRVLFRTDGEQEAFEVEKEWIAHYGRRNLANSTSGGSGVAYTPERRKRKRGVPPEVADQIRVLWNDHGLSYTKISKRLGISVVTVGKVNRRQGIYADDP